MEQREVLGKVMLTREQLTARIRELGQEITRDYEGKSVLVVGVLKGAAPFMSDLIREIDLDVRIDFIAVSSYGSSTESSGVVKINKDLDQDIEGKNVIIVEDIVDTGLTLHYLRDTLMRRHPESIRICTMLDKPERRQADLKADYVGFEVENKFIVGYGLDFDEKYRNLPYITCLED